MRSTVEDELYIDELISEGYEGKWLCPYCYNTSDTNTVCCGENHRMEIKKEVQNGMGSESQK